MSEILSDEIILEVLGVLGVEEIALVEGLGRVWGIVEEWTGLGGAARKVVVTAVLRYVITGVIIPQIIKLASRP